MHNTEQIVFVIIVIVVGIIRWLAKNNSKADQNDPTIWKTPDEQSAPPPRPQRRQMPSSEKRDFEQWQSNKNTEDERVKQFMEALGLPQTSDQPPPLRPAQQEPPPLRRTPAVRPPVYAPPVLQTQPVAQPKAVPPPLSPLAKRSSPIRKPMPAMHTEIPPQRTSSIQEPSKKYKPADWRLEEAAKAAAMRKRAAASELAKARFDLDVLLASRNGIRAGIMLQEILGKPRGLQSFEQVSTLL